MVNPRLTAYIVAVALTVALVTPWTLKAAGSDPWQMIAHGFFGPFVVNYDYQGIYRYLGYCEASNVVYSYYIRATLEWP